MVQYVLSALDSDNVNSISDTEEALQIATIFENTYSAIISRKNWAFMETMQNLEGIGDTTKPTKLKIPDNVQKIRCFRYKSFQTGSQDEWFELIYLSPCDFIHEVQRKNTSNSILVTTNDDGVEMRIITDRRPRYWTSFDDNFVYLDAHQSDFETTSQQSSTSVQGVRRPAWTQSDTFIPFLPEDMFQLLLNEVKSIAFLEMKQLPHAKAEQISRRQYIMMREQEPKADDTRRFMDYGKRTASRGRSHSRWKGTPTSSGIRIEFTGGNV